MWGLSSPTGDWTCSPYPGRWNPNHWTSRGVPRAESSETLTTERFVICEVMWKSLSCVWLFTTPWTIWSMEFSRPEYWSGYPFSSPGDLPNPGIEPRSPALQADSLLADSQGKPRILEWVAYPFSSDLPNPGRSSQLDDEMLALLHRLVIYKRDTLSRNNFPGQASF